MKRDFRNHLLTQIEMLRCAISHEELSERLGDTTERCLARYIAGKTHLRKDEFEKIAKRFNAFGETKPTREGRQKFARAYEMLVEFVHAHQSQRNVGAMHGLSGARAAQLMRRAAYTWAESEGIDLIYDKSMPFKIDCKLVRNLYGGLRFFAQQQFDALSSQVDRDRCNEEATEY